MREINLLIWDQHVALLWAALRDERSGAGGGGGGCDRQGCFQP